MSKAPATKEELIEELNKLSGIVELAYNMITTLEKRILEDDQVATLLEEERWLNLKKT